jgi:hypothetical protein
MEVFILDIKKSSSRHHSGLIYEIEFMDFNGNEYNTYVDPTMRNYTNWQYIVKRSLAGHGFILKDVKLMPKDKTQIHGDSMPTILTEVDDRDQMLITINSHIRYDARSAILHDLFDFGDK